jgi:ferrous iron transport protein B
MITPTKASRFEIEYGNEIEAELRKLENAIEAHPGVATTFEPRWLAIKLLEGEADILARVRGLEGGAAVLEAADLSVAQLEDVSPMGIEVTMADRRYVFVSRVADETLVKPQETTMLSQRIDNAVLNPWVGIPLFLVVMYLVFNIVVNVSAPYLDWIDHVINGFISHWISALLQLLHAPVWLQDLVTEGVIAGVGGIMVFIPGLVVLFFFIGVLEDSGYMARAAVVMDRFMQILGLHGKSFVPLILGFGCAVPAIYATRTLGSRRDRILTALLVPLMSCSARLPVYVVFAMAFFGQNAETVIWGLYAMGVFIATLTGLIFSRTIFRERVDMGFVIELPAYHIPSWKNLRFYVTQRVGEFVRKAGTIILAASVVIWLLLNLPLGTNALEESWFGSVSDGLVPAFQPTGFSRWENTGALLSGLVAKEIVVSTLSQIYVGETEQIGEAPEKVDLLQDLEDIGVGFLSATANAGKELLETLTPGVSVFGNGDETAAATSLGAALKLAFTPLSALAFLVFVLLYVPCIATIGAIASEFGGKWALFSMIWQLGLAWLAAVMVYQGGLFLGYA